MEYNKASAGATLIETMAVIAIGGLMAFAAIRLVPQAMRDMKISDIRGDVMNISQKIRSLYRGEPYDENVHSLAFTALGTKDDNPLGGKYAIAPAGPEGKLFRITITGLTRQDCANMFNGWGETYDTNGKAMKPAGRPLAGDGSSLYTRNSKCEDMPEDDVKITIIYK